MEQLAEFVSKSFEYNNNNRIVSPVEAARPPSACSDASNIPPSEDTIEINITDLPGRDSPIALLKSTRIENDSTPETVLPKKLIHKEPSTRNWLIPDQVSEPAQIIPKQISQRPFQHLREIVGAGNQLAEANVTPISSPPAVDYSKDANSPTADVKNFQDQKDSVVVVALPVDGKCRIATKENMQIDVAEETDYKPGRIIILNSIISLIEYALSNVIRQIF